MCIVLWGSVYRAKSCTSVFLADKFPFVPSDTFAVGYVTFSHKNDKTRGKNESKTQTWLFWDRQSGVHWSCYVLLFIDFVDFGQSRLSGLSLGAFINSLPYPSNSSARTSCPSSCSNRNRFDSLPVGHTVRRMQYTIGYHENSWASWPLLSLSLCRTVQHFYISLFFSVTSF